MDTGVLHNVCVMVLLFSDISLPKSSRRETKVPLKYRMDGDYSGDGKLYSSVNNISTIKQDKILDCKSEVPFSDNRYVLE